MECHYHPEREGTDICAICGKSICKECGLEIAGKIYCKECLEKIVGLSIENTANEAQPSPIETEPAEVGQEYEENIYEPQPQNEIDEIIQEEIFSREPEYETVGKAIRDDSPYNIKDNIDYSEGLESSYLHEKDAVAQQNVYRGQPQSAPNEIDYYPDEITQQVEKPQEYIYPDHEYSPQPTSARQELEDKYERYLDDLYFDENDVPLGEQLAKDEEEYGSLTRRPYSPRQEPPEDITPRKQEKPPKYETPEEMEARIRAEIAREQKGGKKEDENIHNLNYKDEKEPMGIVDILLTIILIIVILIVIYYLIYLFVLNSSYPTFLDALFALSNPQNVINNLLSH